tara:strand:+ start:524 stop:1156 length:633 start_codon:yes stop_codon:yes gene_type:complete
MNNIEVISISGRYRTVVTNLSRLLLSTLIHSTEYKIKKSNDVILFKEIINMNIPLHFYIGLKIEEKNSVYVTGDAYNPTSVWNEEIPYIEILIQTNGDPRHRSEIVFRLANTLRHEIEHLTQSGFNTISGKYLPDDQEERTLVDDKGYLLLPKEINAGVRGIYHQAYKMKKPFPEILIKYLFETYLLESEIEEVNLVYLEKAKELNLWKS